MIKEFKFLILNGTWFFNSRLTILLLIFAALAFTTLALDIKVSGIARDQNGEGLPGSTVLIKATNIGTAAV